MPKAVLEFNLPEEQEEYETVMKASNFSHCLWSFDQEFLRGNTKHGISSQVVDRIMQDLKNYNEDGEKEDGCKYSKEVVADIAESTLDHVRTVLYEYMNENNANPFN